MIGLTPRQRQVYDFLRSENSAGRYPGYGAIRNHIGLGSRSTAKGFVQGLMERGYVRRFLTLEDLRDRSSGLLVAMPVEV